MVEVLRVLVVEEPMLEDSFLTSEMVVPYVERKITGKMNVQTGILPKTGMCLVAGVVEDLPKQVVDKGGVEEQVRMDL